MTHYLPHHTLARTICDAMLAGEHRVETSVIDQWVAGRRGLRKAAVVSISIPAIDKRQFHDPFILTVANTLFAGSEYHPLRAKNFALSGLGGDTGTLSIEASYELPFALAEKRPEHERAQFLHHHALHSLVQVVAAGQVPYDYTKRSTLLAAFPDPRSATEIRRERRWHEFLFWLSKWGDLIPQRIPRDFGEYK